MTIPPDWARVEAALDELLELPPAERPAVLERMTIGDPALKSEIESLLKRFDDTDALLDSPAINAIVSNDLPADDVTIGSRVGVYRLLSLIGRGGMGEVYQAERADDQFEQIVAVKLIRAELADQNVRFQSERQILARLDHPGIARLLDGGVTGDGRLYMVMELVAGSTIVEWCNEHSANLGLRLRLFTAVCDAVAYAHRNLIIHRDIKPGNVLVTDDGTVKLLDFGVAKLLAKPSDNDTQHTTLLTPGYAAPEQLTRGAVTTATDVYALGALLFELLTGRRLWPVRDLPLAVAIDKVLHEPAPVPSRIAAQKPVPSIPPRALQGDLDAIIAKALRKEPAHRYATVDALREDISRTLQGEPVAARAGARLYTLGRILRRYRVAAAGFALVIFLIAGGAVGMGWQASRAERAAARATAINDFLLSVFKASDPRIASDKPRGQITARELLDSGADQIKTKFAADTETEIALLGSLASVYRELGEDVRATDLRERQLALARTRYGQPDLTITDILVDQAYDANWRGDDTAALKLLDQTDDLIRHEGRDQSLIRAHWWSIRAKALESNSSEQQARETAIRKSIDLLGNLAPTSPDYVSALNELGVLDLDRLDLEGAVSAFKQAIAVPQSVSDRDDGQMQLIYGNLGETLSFLAEWDDAEKAFDQAAEIARRTYGKTNGNSWLPVADHARMVHLMGQRVRALNMFEDLLKDLPQGPAGDTLSEYDAAEVRGYYGARLAAEGRPQLGIPLLEAAEREYQKTATQDYNLRRLWQELGDAYDGAGRIDDARRALNAAYDERVKDDPPDFQPLLAVRERWGRFLLDQGDLDGADAQFHEVLAQAHGRKLANIALAQGGLARTAIARKDPVTALREAAGAIDLFDHVVGFRDVRWGPYLWRIQAQAFLLAGQPGAARPWAQKALDASLAYDAPEAASIVEAQALIQAATAANTHPD